MVIANHRGWRFRQAYDLVLPLVAWCDASTPERVFVKAFAKSGAGGIIKWAI